MENAVNYEGGAGGAVTALPAPSRTRGSHSKPYPFGSMRSWPIGHPRSDRELARRILNVTVAAAALVVLTPLLMAIAALVRFTSRGPVLFTQLRVGLDRRAPTDGNQNQRRRNDYGGRLFRIYKFRTMYPGDHGEVDQVWAKPDDPRVTPVGRVLRRFRLDELPQLFNVIRGDMNVVGPRPEQPNIFVDLRGRVESYSHRQRILPGITGWAQIHHSYDRSVDDVRRKVELDLEYLQRRSWTEDLRIMMRTLPVITFQQGAW